MSESTKYKFFRDVKGGSKPKSKEKKYDEMSKEEKEKYLRERNKKQSFSGFEDGGVCKKKSYFEKLKKKIKK